MKVQEQRNWPGSRQARNENEPQVTEFEQLVRELELKPREYANSAELKEWVRKNKDQKYVPSDLLKAWGFKVLAEV